MTTGNQVVEKALDMTRGSYVYWYGGKGQKCSLSLLNNLSKAYPRVYTVQYVKACKKDIAAGKYCIDCSGLVCRAYGIDDEGTYQMVKDPDFYEYTGVPKNGMVLWTWTHCGIYWNGKVIEARGKSYGVTKTRDYKASSWMRIFGRKGVTYGDMTAIQYLQAAADVIDGRYGVGEQRKTALKQAGFDPEKVQDLVNRALK